jgi:hypothetical protein
MSGWRTFGSYSGSVANTIPLEAPAIRRIR